MWNRHNVHKMFINIYIEYRNLETRKTRNWFRYETFYYLWVKGFSTWGERERDTVFLCWLLLHRQLSTQLTRGARCAQIRLASPNSESRLFGLEAGTQLTAFSQISAYASGAWRHSHPLVPKSYLKFLFWHLWMAHPLRARVNTYVNVTPN